MEELHPLVSPIPKAAVRDKSRKLTLGKVIKAIFAVYVLAVAVYMMLHW